MSFFYVWQPRSVSLEAARRELSEALEAQCSDYRALTGDAHSYRCASAFDEILIGTVEREGQIGHDRWLVDDRRGVVFCGIDESLLDESAELSWDSYGADLLRDPAWLATHPGRFFAIAWSNEQRRLVVASSAAESPPAWHTEGPRGWAVGSRARPCLDRVRRPARLNVGAAHLYLTTGYLTGDEALFEGCRRHSLRTASHWAPERAPRIARYLGLADLLRANPGGDIAHCGELLVQRLRNQLRHSPRPLLPITGGRDSRLVAAAARRAGYAGPTMTGGAASNADVVIGAEVAQRLGLDHERSTIDVDAPVELVAAYDQLLSWFRATEGLMQLRTLGGFNILPAMRGEFPVPWHGRQLFNGLGGEHVKGRYYGGLVLPPGYLESRSRDAYRRANELAGAADIEALPTVARAQFAAHLGALEQEARGAGATAGQWLDFYYWHHYTQQWGMDRLEVWSILYDVWTPLIDVRLASAAWERSTRDKSLGRISRELSNVLAPELRDLRYKKEFPETPRAWAIQALFNTLKSTGLFPWYRRLRRLTQPPRRPAAAPKPPASLRALWDLVFFGDGDRHWPALVDAPSLGQWLEQAPTSQRLWNLASIELFARAHDLT